MYNGALLPPLFYVQGSDSMTANRSLTITDTNIIYDTCSRAIWEPVVSFLASQTGASPTSVTAACTCSALLAC